jgi:hypothetical protein
MTLEARYETQLEGMDIWLDGYWQNLLMCFSYRVCEITQHIVTVFFP